jgi:hypothetical protein
MSCPASERLGCWVRAARPDYVPGHGVPLAERTTPHFLLTIIVRGNRFATVLLDLPRSLEAIEHAYAAGRDWRESAEVPIQQSAVETPPTPVDDTAKLEPYFRALLEGPFRNTLEEAGLWRPFGTVEVGSDRAGVIVELDGVRLGTTSTPSVRLVDLSPGRRTLRFVSPEGPVELAVEVSRGAVARVQLPHPSTRPGLVLPIAVGGALSLTGAVLLVLAASKGADSMPRVACLTPHDGSCPSALATTLDGPGALPRLAPKDAGTPGLRPLPLGLALAVAGAGFASLPVLIDDTDPVPWRSGGIAVALGAVAFLLGSLLGGQ